MSKRINRELENYITSGFEGVFVETDNQNPNVWFCLLKGEKNTFWEGGKYFFEIEFPNGYPIKEPIIKFESGVCHPNISLKEGIVCMNTLLEGESWTPSLTALYILKCIYKLFYNPNLEEVIEFDIGKLYSEDPKKFKEKVMELDHKRKINN